MVISHSRRFSCAGGLLCTSSNSSLRRFSIRRSVREMFVISSMILDKGALTEEGRKEVNQEQRVKKAPRQVSIQEPIDQPSAIMGENLEEKKKGSQRTEERAHSRGLSNSHSFFPFLEKSSNIKPTDRKLLPRHGSHISRRWRDWW